MMKSFPILILVAILSVPGAWTGALADDDISARGSFSAMVDFDTLSLTPVGMYCLLQIDGVLEFDGTLVGEATGTTRALVIASCEEVAASPPGSFKDVFRSRLEFKGAVDGEPLIADILYRGRTEVGGEIDAVMLLSNGAEGRLRVNAIVAQGGQYKGVVELEDFDDSD